MRAVIRSARLDLAAMSPAFLRASLRRDGQEAERLLRASLPEDWPDIPHVLSLRLKQLESDPALEPWLLRAIVLRDEGAMIGHIGFHTRPGPGYLEPYSPGAVELGFTVFPAWQRRGYAREAALALMDEAERMHGVRAFVLSIRPQNVASQALARSLRFQLIGSHIDEVEQEEDILERRVPAAGCD